ncbi:MAG TPA: IclR family transcriptional regulator [Terrimesophilobacter sp.]|nr:IclR family transcriptional regulator [Terrimesophilobacter sp.]
MIESSLERGLSLLEEIAAVSEQDARSLASRVGVPLSTTYRYLKSLRERGFVRETEGRYEPGPAALALLGRDTTQARLAALAPSVLDGLVTALGETSLMLVRTGVQALCVARSDPDKELRYWFGINELLPLHAGAGQRVLLAAAPDAVIARVLAADLPAFTPRTLDRVGLRASIAAVRESGWAVSRGELEPGAVSVAVPVHVNAEVVCSLDVVGPESRCGSREWVRRAVDILQATASELSENLERRSL